MFVDLILRTVPNMITEEKNICVQGQIRALTYAYVNGDSVYVYH